MKYRQLYIYLVGPIACGYDEYDSFVVVAYNPAEARSLADGDVSKHQRGKFLKATVENLGKANDRQKPGVVLGSFNAG